LLQFEIILYHKMTIAKLRFIAKAFGKEQICYKKFSRI